MRQTDCKADTTQTQHRHDKTAINETGTSNWQQPGNSPLEWPLFPTQYNLHPDHYSDPVLYTCAELFTAGKKDMVKHCASSYCTSYSSTPQPRLWDGGYWGKHVWTCRRVASSELKVEFRSLSNLGKHAQIHNMNI